VRYDALVVGLGGMGSAVLAHCAARGLRVLGFERFAPAHARGASHGRTRIIRQAYFEGSAYVPLLRRAYTLWDALERETGRPLRATTGGLFVGMPGGSVVAGTLASARAHDLRHDVLDARDLRRRYPQLRPRADEIAIYEPAAGALFPERCVLAHLDVAQQHGGEARFGAPVDDWDVPGPGRVAVAVRSERYEARALVVCAGAWFGRIVAGAGLPLRIERNVQYWFAPRAPEAVTPERLPIFALERDDLPAMLYGFPDFGDGVKCAFHHSGQMTDADALDRRVEASEADAMREALAGWLPGGTGPLRDAVACTYTLTPDEHFIIGPHPGLPEVVLAGGFSGHGFKFCSVVGEIVADIVADGGTAHDIAQFAPSRFAGRFAS
jgi:sarcosine oxidase